MSVVRLVILLGNVVHVVLLEDVVAVLPQDTVEVLAMVVGDFIFSIMLLYNLSIIYLSDLFTN